MYNNICLLVFTIIISTHFLLEFSLPSALLGPKPIRSWEGSVCIAIHTKQRLRSVFKYFASGFPSLLRSMEVQQLMTSRRQWGQPSNRLTVVKSWLTAPSSQCCSLTRPTPQRLSAPSRRSCVMGPWTVSRSASTTISSLWQLATPTESKRFRRLCFPWKISILYWWVWTWKWQTWQLTLNEMRHAAMTCCSVQHNANLLLKD